MGYKLKPLGVISYESRFALKHHDVQWYLNTLGICHV